MKKLIFFLFISMQVLKAQAAYNFKVNVDSINDGPYIFYVNDTLKATMVENGVLNEYIISPANFSELNSTLKLPLEYNDLLNVFTTKPNYVQSYRGVDSIAAISDVHGQFKSYLKQLKANGVIDEELNWKFGTGHFVFNGDACDRGEEVTEMLWHLYSLQKQAAKAGGRVHMLLGNHECMVLDNDLRYLSEKYLNVETITQISYNDLFSETSVLGKWLRIQPVIITINDMLFVHAGVSIDLVHMRLVPKQINKICAEEIIGIAKPDFKDPKIDLLSGDEGPLWYRGYFTDKTFDENRLDSILSFYKTKHIIVGHTTFKKMNLLFNNKIIGIDAGVGYGQPGEMLLYIKGELFKGTVEGERIKL